MSDATSLVKANYALTILRVARTSERDTALRLIEGLATDFPDIDDRASVVAAHILVTEHLRKLAEGIRGPEPPPLEPSFRCHQGMEAGLGLTL